MSRVHINRLRYIESLSEVVSARDDVKNLAYHKDNSGNEYLFMHLMTGDVLFFDIKGLCDAAIFHIIAELECKIVPQELITDDAQRKEIGKRFF